MGLVFLRFRHASHEGTGHVVTVTVGKTRDQGIERLSRTAGGQHRAVVLENLLGYAHDLLCGLVLPEDHLGESPAVSADDDRHWRIRGRRSSGFR